MKFQWIEDHRAGWPVDVLCQVLCVSRSGYYAWRGRPESDRSKRQRELVEEMQAIHQEPNMDSYGSPRMHKELVARAL